MWRAEQAHAHRRRRCGTGAANRRLHLDREKADLAALGPVPKKEFVGVGVRATERTRLRAKLGKAGHRLIFEHRFGQHSHWSPNPFRVREQHVGNALTTTTVVSLQMRCSPPAIWSVPTSTSPSPDHGDAESAVHASAIAPHAVRFRSRGFGGVDRLGDHGCCAVRAAGDGGSGRA